LISDQLVPPETIRAQVAATSVGLIQGDPVLDLCYLEDSQAEVDLNVVMTSDGNFVEIQGTAETKPFSRHQLDQLLDLAESGIRKLHAIQRQALANRRAI
jgi:ribonuclease PH